MKRENVNNKTDIGKIVTMGLSMKRETFCQILVTESCNPTEAYRKAFNVTSDRKATHTEAASRLLKDSNVVARIEALKLGISDKLASEVVWNKARIINELAINVELAREHKQMAASNRSLELVAKVTGTLVEETKQVSGTVSVIHSLSDAVLEQLSGLAAPEPVTIDDTEAIEASFQLLDPEPE